MPIYNKISGKFKKLKLIPFPKEKALQDIVENNLQEMLDMYFLATEYSTTSGGRIDTLAVDFTGAPVIIEYKLNKNDNVINQGLSYLKWLKAQKVDFFEMLVLKKLGKQIAEKLKIDWKSPRVICIAEQYSKFDIDTVEVVPLRIELFHYRYYENDLFFLEPLTVTDNKTPSAAVPVVSETVASEEASVEALILNIPPSIVAMYQEMRQRLLTLDDAIKEKATRYYVAYRVTKNFAEVTIAKQHIKIHMRPVDYDDPRNLVEKIPEGYNWTLDKRVYLKHESDMDYIMGLLEQSYKDVL